MGKVKRLCLVVVSVAGFVSFGFYAVLWFDFEPLLPAAFWLARQAWFGIALPIALGITAAGLAVALVYALAAPGSRSRLVDNREQGCVVIDRKALAATAKRTIERRRELEAISVTVHIAGTGAKARLRIKAKVDPGTATGLATLGANLQRDVADAVETLSGHAVTSVRIHFVGGAAPSRNAEPIAVTAHPVQPQPVRA